MNWLKLKQTNRKLNFLRPHFTLLIFWPILIDLSHLSEIDFHSGTGSNACYVEKTENCELADSSASGKDSMLINTEWGAFGDDGVTDFIRTDYDREIDEFSINKGKQLWVDDENKLFIMTSRHFLHISICSSEKMISGMYMGEIARLAIVRFTKEGLLFGGQGSDLLYKRYQFFTKYVSEIESDKPGSYLNCYDVLEEIGIFHATDEDCANVRYICECVSSRAAHLASTGIAGLINKMNQSSVTVSFKSNLFSELSIMNSTWCRFRSASMAQFIVSILVSTNWCVPRFVNSFIHTYSLISCCQKMVQVVVLRLLLPSRLAQKSEVMGSGEKRKELLLREIWWQEWERECETLGWKLSSLFTEESINFKIWLAKLTKTKNIWKKHTHSNSIQEKKIHKNVRMEQIRREKFDFSLYFRDCEMFVASWNRKIAIFIRMEKKKVLSCLSWDVYFSKNG